MGVRSVRLGATSSHRGLGVRARPALGPLLLLQFGGHVPQVVDTRIVGGVRGEELRRPGASRRRHLSTVLGDFLYALQVNEKFADQWAQAIEQAGADAGSGHVQEWGRHLRQGIQAYVTGEYAETAVMLSRLLERKTLEDQHRVIALRWRGDVHRHNQGQPRSPDLPALAIHPAPPVRLHILRLRRACQ